MHLSFATLSVLLTTLVASESLPFFGGQSQTPLREPKEDILTIEHVNLDPNPPIPGQNLTIEAAGIFKEDVEQGAYVILQVKYGLIRVVNTRADLCEQVQQVDLECPIKKGPTKLTKVVALPVEIPPGKYTVLADVYTKDDRKITCLTAAVTFSKR